MDKGFVRGFLAVFLVLSLIGVVWAADFGPAQDPNRAPGNDFTRGNESGGGAGNNTENVSGLHIVSSRLVLAGTWAPLMSYKLGESKSVEVQLDLKGGDFYRLDLDASKLNPSINPDLFKVTLSRSNCDLVNGTLRCTTQSSFQLKTVEKVLNLPVTLVEYLVDDSLHSSDVLVSITLPVPIVNQSNASSNFAPPIPLVASNLRLVRNGQPVVFVSSTHPRVADMMFDVDGPVQKAVVRASHLIPYSSDLEASCASLVNRTVCSLKDKLVQTNESSGSVIVNLTSSDGVVSGQELPYSVTIDDTSPDLLGITTPICQGGVCYLKPGSKTNITVALQDSVGTLDQRLVAFQIGSSAAQLVDNCSGFTCTGMFSGSCSGLVQAKVASFKGVPSQDDAGNPVKGAASSIVCDGSPPVAGEPVLKVGDEEGAVVSALGSGSVVNVSSGRDFILLNDLVTVTATVTDVSPVSLSADLSFLGSAAASSLSSPAASSTQTTSATQQGFAPVNSLGKAIQPSFVPALSDTVASSMASSSTAVANNSVQLPCQQNGTVQVCTLSFTNTNPGPLRTQLPLMFTDIIGNSAQRSVELVILKTEETKAPDNFKVDKTEFSPTRVNIQTVLLFNKRIITHVTLKALNSKAKIMALDVKGCGIGDGANNSTQVAIAAQKVSEGEDHLSVISEVLLPRTLNVQGNNVTITCELAITSRDDRTLYRAPEIEKYSFTMEFYNSATMDFKVQEEIDRVMNGSLDDIRKVVNALGTVNKYAQLGCGVVNILGMMTGVLSGMDSVLGSIPWTKPAGEAMNIATNPLTKTTQGLMSSPIGQVCQFLTCNSKYNKVITKYLEKLPGMNLVNKFASTTTKPPQLPIGNSESKATGKAIVDITGMAWYAPWTWIVGNDLHYEARLINPDFIKELRAQDYHYGEGDSIRHLPAGTADELLDSIAEIQSREGADANLNLANNNGIPIYINDIIASPAVAPVAVAEPVVAPVVVAEPVAEPVVAPVAVAEPVVAPVAVAEPVAVAAPVAAPVVPPAVAPLKSVGATVDLPKTTEEDPIPVKEPPAWLAYYRPQNSLIVSLASFCLPGIVYNLEKWSTIDCEYIRCLKFDVPGGLPPQECQRDHSYQKCKFVTGEIFNAIPYTAVYQGMMTEVKNVISSPYALATLVVAMFPCDTLKSSGSGFCRLPNALKFINKILSVIRDTKAVASSFKGLKDNFKKESFCDTVLNAKVPDYLKVPPDLRDPSFSGYIQDVGQANGKGGLTDAQGNAYVMNTPEQNENIERNNLVEQIGQIDTQLKNLPSLDTVLKDELIGKKTALVDQMNQMEAIERVRQVQQSASSGTPPAADAKNPPTATTPPAQRDLLFKKGIVVYISNKAYRLNQDAKLSEIQAAIQNSKTSEQKALEDAKANVKKLESEKKPKEEIEAAKTEAKKLEEPAKKANEKESKEKSKELEVARKAAEKQVADLKAVEKGAKEGVKAQEDLVDKQQKALDAVKRKVPPDQAEIDKAKTELDRAKEDLIAVKTGATNAEKGRKAAEKEKKKTVSYGPLTPEGHFTFAQFRAAMSMARDAYYTSSMMFPKFDWWGYTSYVDKYLNNGVFNLQGYAESKICLDTQGSWKRGSMGSQAVLVKDPNTNVQIPGAHVEGDGNKEAQLRESDPVVYDYVVTAGVKKFKGGSLSLDVAIYSGGQEKVLGSFSLNDTKSSFAAAGASALKFNSTQIFDKVCIKFKSSNLKDFFDEVRVDNQNRLCNFVSIQGMSRTTK